jgi:hypothetical protein
MATPCAYFSRFGTYLPQDRNLLHIPWQRVGAVRTKAFDFEPPSGQIRHLSKWVVACFSSSCPLVFDMPQITEFDPASPRI